MHGDSPSSTTSTTRKTETEQWAYSDDEGHLWQGPVEGRVEAIKQGAGASGEPYRVARIERFAMPDECLLAGLELDELESRVEEFLADEYGAEIIYALPNRAFDDLIGRIRSAVDEVVAKHKLKPPWFLVDGATVERIVP